MKKLIYFIVIIAAALLLGSCNKIKRPITENVEYIDTVEQYEYVPTVSDILQARADWKYEIWVDSVYLTIPEQILTHMLVNKGTTMSLSEIVEDYWANKSFYHDTILKTMNIQKKYIPDSIPKKPKQDKPTKNSSAEEKPLL